MPRLFVALDLPDAVKQQITELCAFGLPGVSWVKLEQFHLSLRFIGEVESNRMDDIITCLSKVRASSLFINLKGVGTFPPNKTPRVIWVGVQKNELLLQLRNKVEFQLNQIGIPAERRKFHAHVTIGRVKSKKIKRMGSYLPHYDMFQAQSIALSEFTLFSSLLSPQGAIHTKVKNYQLITSS